MRRRNSKWNNRIVEREKEERRHGIALELSQLEYQQAMELAQKEKDKHFIKEHKIKGPKLP